MSKDRAGVVPLLLTVPLMVAGTVMSQTCAAAAPPPAPPIDYSAITRGFHNADVDAAKKGDKLGMAFMDRFTGRYVGNINGDKPFLTASVVKVFIADQIMYNARHGGPRISERDRRNFIRMIQYSDDSLAQTYWDQYGGAALIDQIIKRYHLAGSRSNGIWWNTLVTPHDMASYYRALLSGGGGTNPKDGGLIGYAMKTSAHNGSDGFDQTFGIRAALNSSAGVKQGWMEELSGDAVRNSTGFFGAGDRYIVIEMTELNHPTNANARTNKLLKNAFPTGRIPLIPAPDKAPKPRPDPRATKKPNTRPPQAPPTPGKPAPGKPAPKPRAQVA